MSETRAAEAAMPPSPGQDSPAVHLVKLMEGAAARHMRRQLSPGQASVSVALNLRHVSTHSPHAEWRVTVRQIAVRGRLHDFEIDVFDASGPTACAKHTRAVVFERRFLAQLRRRAGRPAMLLQV